MARLAIAPVGHALAFPMGVGGLHTMRLEVIMRGDATPSQIAGFIIGLRMKGETVDELTGFARTARDGSACFARSARRQPRAWGT